MSCSSPEVNASVVPWPTLPAVSAISAVAIRCRHSPSTSRSARSRSSNAFPTTAPITIRRVAPSPMRTIDWLAERIRDRGAEIAEFAARSTAAVRAGSPSTTSETSRSPLLSSLSSARARIRGAGSAGSSNETAFMTEVSARSSTFSSERATSEALPPLVARPRGAHREQRRTPPEPGHLAQHEPRPRRQSRDQPVRDRHNHAKTRRPDQRRDKLLQRPWHSR
jgi:hypothetical protein